MYLLGKGREQEKEGRIMDLEDGFGREGLGDGRVVCVFVVGVGLCVCVCGGGGGGAVRGWILIGLSLMNVLAFLF